MQPIVLANFRVTKTRIVCYVSLIVLDLQVPATNMQEVVWDTALAAQAQAHADACVLQHSTNRVNVGENIWAAPYSDFSGAVKMWFDEVYDSRCGCSNGFKECCGHYTQVSK